MITVTDDRSANRFEARDGETLAGFAAYIRTSELVAFVHTEVDPAFEGRGVGSDQHRVALVRCASSPRSHAASTGTNTSDWAG